jgi:type IV pilus assembly protein PilA
MIVVAIVALLAAIAIPNLLRARVNANESNAQAMLRTLSTASESFAAANAGNYPANQAAMTGATPPYLNENYADGNTRQGYSVAITAQNNTGYCFQANPVGSGGNRQYSIQTGGVLGCNDASGANPCPAGMGGLCAGP